ncbi:riboflavin synthase domain-like protein, partial [Ceraceosorus guamensis]
RRLTIVYATETGTAQDVAHRLARVARRRRMEVEVVAVQSYGALTLPEQRLIVLIISTTGQGDFPASSMAFWKFLCRAGLPTDILQDTHFATLALGDSSYERFCWPGRMLHNRLLQLGASPLLPHQDADDQHYLGIDGTLHPWTRQLFDVLEEHYLQQLSPSLSFIPDDEPLPPLLRLVRSSNTNAQASTSTSKLPSPAPQVDSSSSRIHKAVVERNDRMTMQTHFQDVRLLRLLIISPRSRYETGDVAVLQPENSAAEVQRFLDAAGWADTADTLFEMRADSDAPFVKGQLVTLRTLLTRHLSPLSVPRMSFFDVMRHWAPKGSLQREKLDEFCGSAPEGQSHNEGADELYEYAMRVRRTCTEVIEEFDEVRIPPDYILDLLPPLRPREFSIACAKETNECIVELAIALVKYRTRLDKPRRGVCSRWVETLEPGTILPVRFKRGTLRLPQSPQTPVVFVGPGTGVAPIRALVQQRVRSLPARNSDPNNTLVFLGCRHSQRDWLFRDDWKQLAGEDAQSSPILRYFLAASREAEDGAKTYVQDKILEQSALVWDALRYVMISGSSGNMPSGVRKAVEQVAVERGGYTEQQAKEYVEGMITDGRWQEECWS